MRRLLGLGLLAIVLGAAAPAFCAVPLTPDQIPQPLKAWVPWVMHDIEHNGCPFIAPSPGENVCLWPTLLSLELNPSGGTFSYTLTVYDMPDKKPQGVALPGQVESWPQDVMLDGKPAAVLTVDGRPGLFLTAGAHTITGAFQWDSLPATLQVPQAVGLVKLSVNGQEVATPDLESGELWVQRDRVEKAPSQEDRLEAKLFRKVTDGIPLTIDTALLLDVSGKQREEDLGALLPAGAIPTGIDSAIPARIDVHGAVRVQLRAGSWQIHITARYPGPVEALALPAKHGILPDQEIWSFEAQPGLRLAQVEGVDAIDPAQTQMPSQWQGLPAYLMKQGSHFTIVQKKRGIADATPDRLTLARRIWLDFSGNGYTFNDTITGTIHHSTRLEVGDGVQLGNASILGKDQFITTLPQDGKQSNPGVEVRAGNIVLNAGSRIASGAPQFSATGWKNSFDHEDATLYLPPGWSLFSYSGVDKVSQSWITRWTLLDVFFVMLAAMALFKLFGVRTALLGSLALVLLQHDLDGLTVQVLILLAGTAILRQLPAGKFRSLILWVRRIVFLLLLCAVLPFMVEHLRAAIYPQLAPAPAVIAGYGEMAKNNADTATNGGYAGHRYYHREAMAAGVAGDVTIAPGSLPAPPTPDALSDNAPPPPPPPSPMLMSPATPMIGGGRMYALQQRRHSGMYQKTLQAQGMFGSLKSVAVSSVPMPENYQSYAPDTKVQTGFGTADWYNNAIALSWNGTVDPSVKLSLVLISAHENLAIAVIEVLLLAWLLVVLSGRPFTFWKQALQARHVLPVLLLVCLPLLLPHDASAQTARMGVSHSGDSGDAIAPVPLSSGLVYPPPAMLEDLKQKLDQTINADPGCGADCASVSRMQLQVSGNQLIVLEEIHAGADVAVPLPGGVANWRPSAVLVNDAPAPALMQGTDGYLYVHLTSGVSHIKMLGGLPPGRETVGISLPLPAHFGSFDAKGWDVQGIHENGLTDTSLQLTRTGKQQASDEKTLEKSDIPPFFQLERSFTLGQQWEVATTVRRLTAADAPAAVNIPLLAGETVTTGGIPIKGGKAFASFGSGASEVSWHSVITPGPSLHLVAAKDAPWVEVWRMSVSNLWHAVATGIPRVQPASGAIGVEGGSSLWQWQPWPGEAVDVGVTRPQGVDGATATIDASRLDVVPGQRSTDMTLAFTLRSSLGGQHTITLPHGAMLLQVSKGTETLPIELKQDTLSLPVSPGENRFTVRWKHNETLPALLKVPALQLGLARSVNATTVIDMPPDRWILYAHGPQMGPAVLLWSWVPVIAILALCLGGIAFSPLGRLQWFLLLLGMSQAALPVDFIVVAWLLALGARRHLGEKPIHPILFNLLQVILVVMTLVSLSLLLDTISTGLLGTPQMHIAGGDSYGYHLQWYQDIAAATLPRPWVLSLPTWAYRSLVLVWALWLAFSLIGWLRTGWGNFVSGGYWRKTSQGEGKV